jgi:transposase
MQGPLGGDRRSHLVEGHADAILTVFHARRDMALAELQAELAERGLRFDYGTLRRFFARRGYTRKKRLRRRPRTFLSDGLAQSGSPSKPRHACAWRQA